MAEASRRWGVELEPERERRVAEGAVSYARERGMERAAVVDERVLLRDALKHTMGEARLPEIKTELEKRIARGELIEVPRREGEAGRAFTTGEMQGYERDIVRRMQAGRDINVIVDGRTREWTFKQHPHLSLSQHRAVEDVLESRDKMMALEGVAGAGKTTSLAAIRDAVEHHGYEVKGLAPTSRAAQKLAETGIETETLQRHLARGQQPGQQPDGGHARVYIVDEASMVSTRQMHAFLERLNRYDRVLFVGDVRQHEAVEAGRPYAQMQEAGLRTARLDEILRQKDPVLKETVEQLARGIVTIREGKGKKDRVIPIGERAVAWLDKYLDEARPRLPVEPDDMTLFLTAQGEPLGRTTLSFVIRQYVEGAKIGKRGACHLFRHTMATLMHEGGADIRFIQQMLGHARLDTTQIYTHVSIRMLKQIHSATHPAAVLKRDPSEEQHALLRQTQMWPGEPAPTAEELFATLDAEGEEEESN
jgi:integrase